MFLYLDYVAEIYETMVTTSRADLKVIKDELNADVPEPLYNMFIEKENELEAKEKHKLRKNKETVMCPPTCSGNY